MIIIDGLLGTRLNRPVSGVLKKIIQALNSLPNTVLSIDIPSGLFPEFNGENAADGIVQAQHTLSFHAPKLAFLLPEQGEKAGQFHLLDIKLSASFIDEVETPHHYLTSEMAKSRYLSSAKFDHKGTNGHLLLMAGSKGKMGAATLAAKAALRTGLGKLSILTPQCGVEILQNTVSEAMIEFNKGKDCLSGHYGLNHSTISMGPGLGTHSETQHFLNSVFTQSQAAMVIDADAINLLAAQPELLKKLLPNSILTPHPKEFERLIGRWKDDQEKLERLRDFVQNNQLICILKGAHTAIALPDGNIWFNSSGNPGMATAGSGDVLAGIIGGLLAKGYTPESAALMGVYAHGRAADLQGQLLSYPFMLASDIINGLNEVWMEMEKFKLEIDSLSQK
ncbi:MAG: NAD(P)H-hydrate dehydratase [Flavobacteriaceae bacterium]|nr:NAD(P)H-hydrate dehydratase [Flavobacteriaceae bacterium]